MMLSQEEILRYDRQLKVAAIGVAGQEKLKMARVLIIGAGGLGCPVLQYLAAAGVGNITVIDGDNVSESNLQRQILFTHTDIGKSKSQTAALKASEMNPYINVSFIHEFLSVQKALTVFESYDLIIDCCDNFGTRYLVNDVCLLYKLPFISSALFRTEAQFGIFNVLMNNGTFSSCYRDFFPESAKSNTVLDCNEAGVVATLPGIMGLYQANEAIKYLIQKENCSINKIMIFNCWDLSHFFLNINPSSNVRRITREHIESTQYHLPCSTSPDKIIDIHELLNLISSPETVIVDVREEHEVPLVMTPNIHRLPLSILETKIAFFENINSVIFVCKSGIRSKKALDLLESKYPNKYFYSFKHGIETLLQYLPQT